MYYLFLKECLDEFHEATKKMHLYLKKNINNYQVSFMVFNIIYISDKYFKERIDKKKCIRYLEKSHDKGL